MQALQIIALSVLPALVIIAGLQDLATVKIRNWVSIALVVAFFPVALLVGLDPMTIAVHVGIGVVTFAVTIGLFAIGQFGGGDAKLMPAVMLWFGLSAAPFILWTSIIHGLFIVSVLIAGRFAQPYLAGLPAWISTLLEQKRRFTFGLAIAAGALIAWPTSSLVIAWQTGG